MQNLDVVKDIIGELINSGVGRAAKSMNELLNHEIQMSVPVIHILTHDEMRGYISQYKASKYVNVIQSFLGNLQGQGIVSFPVIKGKTLVNMLLETSGNCTLEFDLDEREAILEVGNLIINAVQGVISDMIGQEVECQLPEIIFDDRILSLDRLKEDDIYIVGEMILAVKGIDIEGSILLMYAYDNMGLLVNKFLSLYEEE